MDPQSLHKYTYVHNNPVNAIDPSGKFAVMTQQVATLSIQEIGISLYVSWLAWDALSTAGETITDSVAKQEIEMFVQTVPSPFTQQQFDALEERIKARTGNRRDGESIYLHYSFRNIAHIFRNGAGLKAPSWCTREVYPTGWHAKYFLALYTGGPRDAVYIVLPRKSDLVHYGGVARGQWDSYPPTDGTWLKGGGKQWYCPRGTSPGTVFGPIPISEGNLSDIIGGN